jgi:formylglycine-generating enzyme required for sulfatase activity
MVIITIHTSTRGGDDLDAVAWYNLNSDNGPHSVGTKRPNALGIYDMTGSVYEWTATPNATGGAYMARGGSWGKNNPHIEYCFEIRGSHLRHPQFGFRILLGVE